VVFIGRYYDKWQYVNAELFYGKYEAVGVILNTAGDTEVYVVLILGMLCGIGWLRVFLLF
jgi:hypothetical protein